MDEPLPLPEVIEYGDILAEVNARYGAEVIPSWERSNCLARLDNLVRGYRKDNRLRPGGYGASHLGSDGSDLFT